MDIPILEFCPRCQAPLTPAMYKQCISQDENMPAECKCCQVKTPTDFNKEKSDCSVCGKKIKYNDFKTNQALIIQDNLVCVDCLKAKRIAERERGVFTCNKCNTELTPLDFLEEDAIVKNMLIY